jgi:catechol 2,3-dioxygenase-like lactoylglutathione lyase family enzyme
MEINGVAHTFITAGDFAAARAFYAQLLPFLGLTIVADTVTSAAVPVSAFTRRHPNMPASASGKARSDCITTAFVPANAPMSTRRMNS